MAGGLAAVAYVSWGLWVANCPRLDCLGAEHYGHAPVTGHVGGLTREGFRCNRCGLVCRSSWPGNAADIWTVLQQRPLPETRNWFPGEALHSLILENVAHGLIPEMGDDIGDPALVRWEDGRIVGGRWAVAGPYQVRPKEIGS